MLAALAAVESWLETQPVSKGDPAVEVNLKTAQQIKAQDVEMTQTGTATLRKGVAKDRRISIEDAQMRAFPQEPQCARGWVQTPCCPRFGQRVGA